MSHDPKAQDVMTESIARSNFEGRTLWSEMANDALTALTNAGLCVVSDAAEPADAEQRAAAVETAIRDAYANTAVHRVTFEHRPGRCSWQGCWCGERP